MASLISAPQNAAVVLQFHPWQPSSKVNLESMTLSGAPAFLHACDVAVVHHACGLLDHLQVDLSAHPSPLTISFSSQRMQIAPDSVKVQLAANG